MLVHLNYKTSSRKDGKGGVAVIHKEIEWHRLETEEFECLRNVYSSNCLISCGLSFALLETKLNVHFLHPLFIDKLREKFNVSNPKDGDIPEIFFVDRSNNPRESERDRNCGYISRCGRKAVVFANEFGIFKSVINSFASYLAAPYGYVPVHASVVEINGCGILFVGGHNAGKTTVLINFIDDSIRAGDSVRVLTDDWAIIHKEAGYIAQTFDPSISLKLSDLRENAHLLFVHNQDLKQLFNGRTKISLHPQNLYGLSCNAESIELKIIVLLTDQMKGSVISAEAKVDDPQKIVDAAYHYPYVIPDQTSEHVSFWRDAIKQLRFISFARGNPEDKIKNIKFLRKKIL